MNTNNKELGMIWGLGIIVFLIYILLINNSFLGFLGVSAVWSCSFSIGILVNNFIIKLKFRNDKENEHGK